MKKFLSDLKWSWKNDHKWRRDMKVWFAANALCWVAIAVAFLV